MRSRSYFLHQNKWWPPSSSTTSAMGPGLNTCSLWYCDKRWFSGCFLPVLVHYTHSYRVSLLNSTLTSFWSFLWPVMSNLNSPAWGHLTPPDLRSLHSPRPSLFSLSPEQALLHHSHPPTRAVPLPPSQPRTVQVFLGTRWLSLLELSHC